MYENGCFYWNELMTRDPESAKAYYGEVLGWRFEQWGDGSEEYYVAMLNNKPVAGVFNMSAAEFDGLPEHWFSYVAVDDVDGTVEKAKKVGGQLLKPLFDVPDVGRIAILQDSNGAVVGLIAPSEDSD